MYSSSEILEEFHEQIAYGYRKYHPCSSDGVAASEWKALGLHLVGDKNDRNHGPGECRLKRIARYVRNRDEYLAACRAYYKHTGKAARKEKLNEYRKIHPKIGSGPKARFTYNELMAIRALKELGVLSPELASIYGCSSASIRRHWRKPVDEYRHKD